MVVINILLAAELVIAPVKVGGYENEAIHNLQEQVDDLREINPELRIKGLVTMRQKNKTSMDFEEWMKTSSGFDMFVTPIRRSIVAGKGIHENGSPPAVFKELHRVTGLSECGF